MIINERNNYGNLSQVLLNWTSYCYASWSNHSRNDETRTKNGFVHGWAVGLGGMTIDFMLIMALYFGFASVLALPFIQIPLWIIGAGFLAYLGYDSIKTQIKILHQQTKRLRNLF